jgi:hypothetical protein
MDSLCVTVPKKRKFQSSNRVKDARVFKAGNAVTNLIPTAKTLTELVTVARLRGLTDRVPE